MSNNTSNLQALLGDKLVTNNGEDIQVSSVAKSSKIVLLYFSAHWCPPCRSFTPKLSAAYAAYKKRLVESGQDEEDAAELIFVSSDSDTDTFNEYHKEMTFPALPFDQRELKEALSKKFDVQGIPTLVAMNLQGESVHEDGSVDLRSLVVQHGGSAFPFTKDRLAQLDKEAEAKRESAFQSLMKESSGFNVQEPGKLEANTSFSELLAQNEYVSLLFGDGDFSDPMYQHVGKAFKDSTAIPVYVGWKLYNEQSDHAHLAARFHSFPTMSQEQKELLSSIAGPVVLQNVPSVVTLRRGTGLCSLDGTCEPAGVPVIESVDPMMRKIVTHGSCACPWNDESVDAAQKAEKVRLDKLKTRLPNLEILDGGTLISKDGQCKTAKDLMTTMGDDGVVALYFSAHWCPPCRYLTPELVKCYESIKAAGKNFEVVFVSSDRSKEDFDEYFSSMVTGSGRQWLALDYDQRDLKSDLSYVFDVEGIPTLVLLKKDGTVISRDGVKRVMNNGVECFPWDDATIEKVKEGARQREKNVEEEQRSTGGIVLRRLIGEAGGVDHKLSERLLSFSGDFLTVGAPEGVSKSGTFYYELEILETGKSVAQFGFALAGNGDQPTETIDEDNGLGVGDDEKSWAVDGFRQQLWHKETPQPFTSTWGSGDVVGLAVNVEEGKIAVSKNGSWSKEDGCGVVFQSESIPPIGVYPSFSVGAGNKLRYNMKEEDFKYAEPPASVWN